MNRGTSTGLETSRGLETSNGMSRELEMSHGRSRELEKSRGVIGRLEMIEGFPLLSSSLLITPLPDSSLKHHPQFTSSSSDWGAQGLVAQPPCPFPHSVGEQSSALVAWHPHSHCYIVQVWPGLAGYHVLSDHSGMPQLSPRVQHHSA